MRDYIYIYTVISKGHPELSFSTTLSLKESKEFISRKLRVDHLEHFKSWCSLHKRDFTKWPEWEFYLRHILSKEERNAYNVSKIKMPIKKLVAILRIYCNYVPIGCSFDDNLEVENLLQTLSPETLEKLNKEVEEEEKKNGIK